MFTHKTLQIRRSYSTIVESMLAMFILGLVIFGILQLFQLSIAQMVTDYASFRAARSAAVGFDDYLIDRETRVKAIPVSGDMTAPETPDFFSGRIQQFYYEKAAVEDYLQGVRYLNYEYWNGSNIRHTDYKCVSYGTTNQACTCENGPVRTYLSIQNSTSNNQVKSNVAFRDYPMIMPGYRAFTSGRNTHIASDDDIKISNYAQDFLE